MPSASVSDMPQLLFRPRLARFGRTSLAPPLPTRRILTSSAIGRCGHVCGSEWAGAGGEMVLGGRPPILGRRARPKCIHRRRQRPVPGCTRGGGSWWSHDVRSSGGEAREHDASTEVQMESFAVALAVATLPAGDAILPDNLAQTLGREELHLLFHKLVVASMQPGSDKRPVETEIGRIAAQLSQDEGNKIRLAKLVLLERWCRGIVERPIATQMPSAALLLYVDICQWGETLLTVGVHHLDLTQAPDGGFVPWSQVVESGGLQIKRP